MNDNNSKMNEKIFVRINKAGFIPQIRMQGPIPNPIKITRGQAQSMIVSGITVYEVDPVTKKATELTLQNVYGEKKKQEPEKTGKPNTQNTSKPNGQTPIVFPGAKKDEVTKDPSNGQIPMNLEQFKGEDDHLSEESDSAESEKQAKSFHEFPKDLQAVTPELSKIKKGKVVSTITD